MRGYGILCLGALLWASVFMALYVAWLKNIAESIALFPN